MKPRYVTFHIALCATLLSGIALVDEAQAADKAARIERELKSRFAKADANGDRKLTQAEADGKMPRVHAHFAEIDVNHQGFVTLEDIERFLMAKKAAREKPAGQ